MLATSIFKSWPQFSYSPVATDSLQPDFSGARARLQAESFDDPR
jgi:hypothetical protein